jgi:hypothetical protein
VFEVATLYSHTSQHTSSGVTEPLARSHPGSGERDTLSQNLLLTEGFGVHGPLRPQPPPCPKKIPGVWGRTTPTTFLVLHRLWGELSQNLSGSSPTIFLNYGPSGGYCSRSPKLTLFKLWSVRMLFPPGP